MATAKPAEAQFNCSLGKEELLFRRLHAREELGRLPEYRVELLRPSDKKPVKPVDLLGKNASVSVSLPDGTQRHFHSVVTRFEQGGVSGRFDVYYLVLRPWLWHLTLGADCRVFQEKTAEKIIDAVFANYKNMKVEKKLTGSFVSRPFTVQYRESDFNFVSRLMEEEGIYYYFKHEASQHTMVLCNSASGHAPAPGETLLWAASITTGTLRRDVVTRWSRAHMLQSLAYASTDFAADTPTSALNASATRPAKYGEPAPLEVFDYPGGQENLAMLGGTSGKVSEGKRRAQLHVNAFESEHSVAAGLTLHRPLAVGMTFKLKGHDTDDGGYLATSALYEMAYTGYEAGGDNFDTTTYSCSFEAVPQAVAFQPERHAETPLIHGPQTATVVGAQGDEIFTDKYGRVKVQFHWDRVAKKDQLAEKSSCWVRVSHPWASKQFGMVALPRVGDEVVVEFLEGNPDRPLITGRVYNGDNMHPWELPAQATVSGIKTRSSKGGGADNFNELRFDDKKGSEYVWMQAEKDHHHLVKNDAFVTIKHDRFGLIERDSGQKIGGKMDLEVTDVASVKVDADTHVTLGADLNLGITGALNIDVGEALAFKVGQAVGLSSGQAMDIAAGAALNITATAALHIKAMGVVIDGGAAGVSIKSGGSFISIQPDGVYIKGPMVYVNSGGAAGSATSAAKASPAKPKAPKAPKDNKDPLAK